MSDTEDMKSAGSDKPSAPSGKADYEVGYRKPPQQHRFRKGQSGNPKGRRKAQPIEDTRALIDNILAETVQVRDGGEMQSMSRLEAVLRAHSLEALNGNPKAARTFYKLLGKAGLASKAPPQSLIRIVEPGGDDGKMSRMHRAEQEALARNQNSAQSRTPVKKHQ